MKSILSSSVKSLIFGICFGIGVIGTAAIAITVSATFNDGDTLSATSLNALKTAVESIPDSDYIWIQDEKAPTVVGGGCTSGTWWKRDLNTEKADSKGLASLSDNQITLAAGTYRILASIPGYVIGSNKSRLYNVSDASVIISGTSAYSGGTNTTTNSLIKGQFTISEAKTLEIQHRCETTRAPDGFGHPFEVGENEVYTVVELWRISD
jgi:hypothetical protein